MKAAGIFRKAILDLGYMGALNAVVITIKQTVFFVYQTKNLLLFTVKARQIIDIRGVNGQRNNTDWIVRFNIDDSPVINH